DVGEGRALLVGDDRNHRRRVSKQPVTTCAALMLQERAADVGRAGFQRLARIEQMTGALELHAPLIRALAGLLHAPRLPEARRWHEENDRVRKDAEDARHHCDSSSRNCENTWLMLISFGSISLTPFAS